MCIRDRQVRARDCGSLAEIAPLGSLKRRLQQPEALQKRAQDQEPEEAGQSDEQDAKRCRPAAGRVGNAIEQPGEENLYKP